MISCVKKYKLLIFLLGFGLCTHDLAASPEMPEFVVSNINNEGAGSLRQAILDANASVGVSDVITFNISGAGPHVILPVTSLPAITDELLIDGSSEPDFTGTPVLVLDGSVAGSASGLVLSANNCTIRALVINNFTEHGIVIEGNQNTIAGNFIGTDASGMLDEGNDISGIYVLNGASNTIIGGSTAADRNVLSGNGDDNISISGSAGTGNIIIGNYIGVDVLGTSALGNGSSGFVLSSDSNVVGGKEAGEGNIIAGSGLSGLVVNGDKNTIQGNYIGTDVSGTLDLGNGRHGILINGSSNNLIGGVESGSGNLIYNNGERGVLISNGTSMNNTILGNSIFGNSGIGLDLSNQAGGDNVTPNDANDFDMGPNGLQNYPVIDHAVATGDHLSISGSLNSGPDHTYRIEFFSSPDADPSGYGEGKIYLGFTSVTTDGSGNANFDLLLKDAAVEEGDALTATATEDLGGGNYGNSSEFSESVTAIRGAPSNDLPCDASLIDVEDACSTNVFNNFGSGDSGLPLAECIGYAGADSWFKTEVPVSGLVRVSLDVAVTPEIPDPEDWLGRPGLAVYSGECASPLYDTCWIDPNEGAPYLMPDLLLKGLNPGDTLFFRIWEHSGGEGYFRLCAEEPDLAIFNVTGSGSYCVGETGLTVSLDGSETGVDYQLLKNGIELGDPIPGSEAALTWPDLDEGIYEVSARRIAGGLTSFMHGKAIIMADPLPLVTFGYGYDKEITIEADSVKGSSDFVDFPLLVDISADNDLAGIDFGGRVEHPDGYDIAFTDSLYQPLEFELVDYISGSGRLLAWIKVPLLAAKTDTELHLLYGKTGMTTDPSSNAVWDTSFKQVLHMEKDLSDASVYRNFGRNDSSSSGEGKIGNGRVFDGIDDLFSVDYDSSMQSVNTAATLSMWINFVNSADGDYQLILCDEERYSNEKGFEWAQQGDGDHYFYPNGFTDLDYNLGPNPFSNGQWHYLVTTLDYSTKDVKIFIDGDSLLFSIKGVPANWAFPADFGNWLWGGNPGSPTRYFYGKMDEIMIQNKVRSQDWIRTAFSNQNTPSSFYSLSEEQEYLPLPDVCKDAGILTLDQGMPAGGTYSGSGVSGGNFDPGIASSGTHFIQYLLTDLKGCTGSGSSSIKVNELPEPSVSGMTTICEGITSTQNYSVTDFPGHSYNWTVTGAAAIITGGQGTNEVTVDWGDASGTVSVTEIIDATGCESTTIPLDVTVGDNIAPEIACPEDQIAYLSDSCTYILEDYLSIAITDNCDPDPLNNQFPLPGAVIWGDSIVQSVQITSLDINGNLGECTFQIALVDSISPKANGINDIEVQAPEGFFTAGVNIPAPNFTDNCGVWTAGNDFSSGNSINAYFPYGSTSIVYTVTDSAGNVSRFSRTITVHLAEEPAYGLAIPEGFSPNGDGLNDRFEILGLEQFPENQLRIFNVQGLEIYRMDHYDNSWDGRSNKNLNKGTHLPSATYYYILDIGQDELLKGTIYLRRE